MPRSPVQFQKGQSLAEFTDRYGSEEQCRAALFQARWPQGFECPECGRKRCCRLRCRNVFQCTRCRHQVLADGQHRLREHQAAAEEMVSRHVSADPVEERSLGDGPGASLGVSYNTAWSLKHKLMQVMKERDESGPLGHIVQVDDAYLGGRNPRRQTRDEGRRARRRSWRPCRSPKKAGRWRCG